MFNAGARLTHSHIIIGRYLADPDYISRSGAKVQVFSHRKTLPDGFNELYYQKTEHRKQKAG